MGPEESKHLLQVITVVSLIKTFKFLLLFAICQDKVATSKFVIICGIYSVILFATTISSLVIAQCTFQSNFQCHSTITINMQNEAIFFYPILYSQA